MDNKKAGELICALRKERGLTQLELAEKLHISDKAVSKWERGLGYPDISLLAEISKIFGVDIEKILSGNLDPKEKDGGDMKRVKFYVCPGCGNIITSSAGADISCCGRKLPAETANPCDDAHRINVEEIEYDYYVTFAHPMSKEHFISFAAYVSYDRVLILRQYPEQSGELRFPKMHGGKLYLYCNRDGLMVYDLPR